MPEQAAAKGIEKPTQREAVGLTIILLLEVFLFMGAVFGIALSDGMSARETSQALAVAKIAGKQHVLAQRLEDDLARIAVTKTSAARDSSFVSDAQQAATEYAAAEVTLVKGGQFSNGGTTLAVEPNSDPARAAEMAKIDGALPALLEGLGRLARGVRPAERAQALDEAKTRATVVASSSKALAESGGATSNLGATLRNWFFRIAIVLVLGMIATLFQRVGRSRRELERYANDLERRTEEAISSTRQLGEAKAGTDLIMETVDRGLFLLDRDYKIQSQYSRELERMFRLPELAGYNFANLLQRLLTERTFEISRDYMALLFDKKKKERTVLRVNPLAEIEVHFANPAGGFDSRFLNFTFRRIVENDQVARVFVAVSDITDRVRLERQLRESEARKERQFEFLLGVLHVEPSSLDDFLKTANEQVAIMNDALRASDFAANTAGRMELLRQRLDIVYRAVHTVKGNASMLELAYFEKTCDIFEGKIVQLRERSALGGDDFLAVVIAQSELRQDLDELQDLRERFVGLGRMTVAKPTSIAPKSEPAQDVVATIDQFAAQLGAKLHKDVRVEAPGFSTAELPDALRRTVRDVLVQLTRNSLVHGLETASVREALGKTRTGTIAIARLRDTGADTFGFTFRDDGAGLDPVLIREKAVAKGIITPEQAAKISDEQLVGLIFRPAFSTLDEPTTDAGRGIGMNVIKEAVVDKCGGHLSMNSEPGKYTEFSFLLPIVAVAPPVRPSNGAATLAYN
ncbi:MAG: hypothetical protein NVSMB19_23420 [Vulcanimicrobiaceae bacterium]